MHTANRCRPPLQMFALSAFCVLALAGCEVTTEPEEPPVPLWSVSGTGNTVIDRPRTAHRVIVTAAFLGLSSNFIVWCGTGQLVVNEIIGTRAGYSTTYQGTHQLDVGCNPIRIDNSNGVSWSFNEVR